VLLTQTVGEGQSLHYGMVVISVQLKQRYDIIEEMGLADCTSYSPNIVRVHNVDVEMI